MKKLFLEEFLLVGLLATLAVAEPELAATTTTTEIPVEVNYTDSLGRSMSLDQLPRQGRIINDEKISIKGFIPIVGLSNNDDKSSSSSSSVPERRNPGVGIPVSDTINSYDDQMGSPTLPPQHHAGPEDQRFIGAAIQGLIGRPFKPAMNRKSDCVCVPFYLCRNGFIVGNAAGGNVHPSMYHERRPGGFQQDISYDHLLQQPDLYGAINERSEPTSSIDRSDLNDTRFAEEILGRMIGASQSDSRCGLLRTCCQRPPHSANQMISINEHMDYIMQQPQPEPSQYLPTTTMIGHQPPFQPGGVGSFNPIRTIRPPNNHHHHLRPPKVLGGGGSTGGFRPNIVATQTPLAYQNCGARQSVGINGRVQNLNYHQSSTEFAEFPWQVAILKRIGPSDNLYVCGGALISPNFVLTAAHCIKKFQSADLKIRLGEWDVHREDEFYPYVEKNVEELFVHPNFVPRNLMNDVALLRLDGDVDLSQNPHISPICMPQPFESFAGQRCYVAGWGKNAFGHQGEYQSVLMKVDLPVLDGRNCETLLRHTKLGFQFRLDRSMICAGGEPGKDACEGDGGSGLVCETPAGIWKVAGLVSWGLGCGQGGVPGVYTNVGHLRPWIDKIVLSYRPSYHLTSSGANFNELINERSMPTGNQTQPTTANTNNSTSVEA